jgi:hypothetical protein
LDLRGRDCPAARGGRRGLAVAHRGVGDGTWQIWASSTAFEAHAAHGTPGPPRGGAAVAFGPWARMLGQEAPAGVALAVDPTGAGLDA